MNSDPLSELWNSAPNRHDPAEGERVAAEFAARLRRRRRWQAVWLAWTFLALAATTALALRQLASGGADPSETALQWALAPLLGVPWLVAVHFLRAFFRAQAAPPTAAQPLHVVLTAARASNARERRRLAIVLVLLATMVPVVALAIRQLELSGKAAPHEAWSMALAFGAALALGATFAVLRLRYRVSPERRAIESLLRDLESSTGE